jgi:hypothetical protein
MYDTAGIAYQRARARTLKIWFEFGSCTGKQYSYKELRIRCFTIGRDLKSFNCNIPEFVLEKKGSVIAVLVLSPRFQSLIGSFHPFVRGGFLRAGL